MTLIELVTALRKNILQDTGGHGFDWEDSTNEEPLKWSNSELVDYINAGEQEIARRTRILTDATSTELTRINVKSGTHTYDLDTRIIDVTRAKLASARTSLVPISFEVLDSRYNSWESDTGTVYNYILDWEYGKIRLYRTPTEDGSLELRVVRLPLDPMTWDNRESAEPEIPAHMQYPMLYWAAHLAYQKDEPNTLDPERANYFEGKFANEVGPRTDFYSEQKRKMKRPRGITYGGIR